jgi:hypothetical protein
VIALVTAIFAVINAVWLNALPFAEPRNVVVIGRTSVTAPSPRPGPFPSQSSSIGRSGAASSTAWPRCLSDTD